MRSEIETAIKTAVQELYRLELRSPLEHPKQDSFGDFASPAALEVAREMDVDPLEIANQLKIKLGDSLKDWVAEIQVEKPGFLNFWLKDEILVKEAARAGKEADRYGSSDLGKGKTVVIDYSAPNIAKRFGIGHLRSTVIGQALYNLYKFSGYKVVGDNHLGDWGTQFGALLRQITNYQLPINKLTIDKLEELYVDFHREAEEKPKLMEEAREWFLRLESGDKEARAVWQAVVEVSRKDFDRIYALLGVEFDFTYPESFYEAKMPAVIAEVRKKGLSRKSDGAEIIDFPTLSPAILIKSDGATTYFTRDLATIKFRIEEWDPQTILYEVGSDQNLHFQQVFAAAKMLGWADGREFVHVAHGLVRFAEGKLSTRRGQTVQLDDVLDESIARAKKLTGGNEDIARAVGVGALKYFDLSHQPQTDIIFDWEKLFLLEGNSAPYLQYTYARAKSVLAKAPKTEIKIEDLRSKILDAEMPLLRYIYRFPEAVTEAAKTYSPNLLANYIFELAQRFNSFYAAAPIIKAKENKDLRLALTSATAQVLKNGLTLLGIETPERL
ncbi:MAG TPA: arginine--tRNA ligase [Patescibacteria group bacterium]|nr:arginine--tRNA ligase [Patescibacteria group bacterium]